MKGARRRDFDLVLDFSPGVETQLLSHVVMRARTISARRLPGFIEMFLGIRDSSAAPRSQDR